MEVSGQLHAPAALPLGKDTSTHWTEGWVGPSTGLDAVVKTKNIPSLTLAVGYGLDVRGFESRQGLGIFLFATASRPALGPTRPPIQWIPRALSLGVKCLGREADHSPPSSAEVEECVELYLHSPIRLHGAVFGLKKKHSDNFTFTLS
jgi:hypothetical protein